MVRLGLLAAVLICGIAFVQPLAGAEAAEAGQRHRGKKILWVDSYHEEYEWSAGIERSLRDVLEGRGVILKVFHLDTKRHLGPEYGHRVGLAAKRVIETFRPDVVIASDDNAQRYLVVPHLRDTALPVVFCGVNADLGDYGYPCRNVTGMIENEMAEGLVMHLRNFARGGRAGILGGDTTTLRIVAAKYNRQFFNGRMKSYLVHSFAEFKEAYLRAQREVDMLFLRNKAAIADWDAAEAEAFVLAHGRIPSGSVLPWMQNYNLFTIAKYPEEQGEYAATVALRILDGEKPADIPPVPARMAHLIVNLKVARATGVVLPISLLQTAELIGQDVFDQPVAKEGAL